MLTEPDKLDADRMTAHRLALQLGAPETAQAIRNSDLCFPQICRVAVRELGAERVTSLMEITDSPQWRWICLCAAYDEFSAEQRARLITLITKDAYNSFSVLRAIGNKMEPSVRAPLIKAVMTESSRADVLLGYVRHGHVTLTEDERETLSRSTNHRKRAIT